MDQKIHQSVLSRADRPCLGLETTSTSFRWAVDQFSEIARLCAKLESPSFPLNRTSVPCHLELELDRKPPCLLVHVAELVRTSLEVVIEPAIESESCDKLCKLGSRSTDRLASSLGEHVPIVSRFALPATETLTREKLDGGALLVVCKIYETTLVKREFPSSLSEPESSTSSSCLVVTGLRELYRLGQLCDINLLVDKARFAAHKTVLAVVSPRFRDLFLKDPCLQELILGPNIEIQRDDGGSGKDSRPVKMSPETVQFFLDCIYGCCEIDGTDEVDAKIELESLCALLALTRFYQVDRLTRRCEQWLIRDLKADNVLKLLLLAYEFDCLLLQRTALNFAKDNIQTLKETPDFGEVYKNRELVMQLL